MYPTTVDVQMHSTTVDERTNPVFWCARLHPIPHLHAQTVFDVMDLDSSGTITMDEFQAALKSVWSSPVALTGVMGAQQGGGGLLALNQQPDRCVCVARQSSLLSFPVII